MSSLVITDYLNKNHSANLCSKSGCVSAILIFITFFLPLFLVVQTHNYWTDTSVYYEQPKVRHLNELMVFLYTDDGIYTFGSTKQLTDLIDGSTQFQNADVLAPQFQILNFDQNDDGKADQIEVNLHLTVDGSTIKSLAIFQTVIYSIEDKISANIKSRFMNIFQTPDGIQKLQTQGELVLNQKENYGLGQVEREIGMQDNNQLELLLQTQDILTIMRNQQAQNTTVDYKINAQYVSQSINSQGGAKNEEVEIKMLMDIPVNQQIRFKPSFIESAVNLWTQYLALLIPAYFIIYEMILGNAFRNKILSSKIWSEIKHAYVQNDSKQALRKNYNF